tara:strand:- start:215 stop:1084 length:870 start_codon:yes stop_codon:yes gene_type:complete
VERVELWEVGLREELKLVWQQEDSRAAIVRGGRLAWVGINEDYSLALEISADFPVLSKPYRPCAMPRPDQGMWLSPNGRQLAWTEHGPPGAPQLRLYDLESPGLTPHFVVENALDAWLGDFGLVTLELNRSQVLKAQEVFLHLPPRIRETRRHQVPRRPLTLWGSGRTAWVGLDDGSVLEIPFDPDQPTRSFRYSPIGTVKGKRYLKGAKTRRLRSTPTHLFATTHSSSGPCSQLVAWSRAPGASRAIEVIRFVSDPRPELLTLDPQRGLVAIAMREAPEGLWILRLHE